MSASERVLSSSNKYSRRDARLDDDDVRESPDDSPYDVINSMDWIEISDADFAEIRRALEESSDVDAKYALEDVVLMSIYRAKREAVMHVVAEMEILPALRTTYRYNDVEKQLWDLYADIKRHPVGDADVVKDHERVDVLRLRALKPRVPKRAASDVVGRAPKRNQYADELVAVAVDLGDDLSKDLDAFLELGEKMTEMDWIGMPEFEFDDVKASVDALRVKYDGGANSGIGRMYEDVGRMTAYRARWTAIQEELAAIAETPLDQRTRVAHDRAERSIRDLYSDVGLYEVGDDEIAKAHERDDLKRLLALKYKRKRKPDSDAVSETQKMQIGEEEESEGEEVPPLPPVFPPHPPPLPPLPPPPPDDEEEEVVVPPLPPPPLPPLPPSSSDDDEEDDDDEESDGGESPPPIPPPNPPPGDMQIVHDSLTAIDFEIRQSDMAAFKSFDTAVKKLKTEYNDFEHGDLLGFGPNRLINMVTSVGRMQTKYVETLSALIVPTRNDAELGVIRDRYAAWTNDMKTYVTKCNDAHRRYAGLVKEMRDMRTDVERLTGDKIDRLRRITALRARVVTFYADLARSGVYKIAAARIAHENNDLAKLDVWATAQGGSVVRGAASVRDGLSIPPPARSFEPDASAAYVHAKRAPLPPSVSLTDRFDAPRHVKPSTFDMPAFPSSTEFNPPSSSGSNPKLPEFPSSAEFNPPLSSGFQPKLPEFPSRREFPEAPGKGGGGRLPARDGPPNPYLRFLRLAMGVNAYTLEKAFSPEYLPANVQSMDKWSDYVPHLKLEVVASASSLLNVARNVVANVTMDDIVHHVCESGGMTMGRMLGTVSVATGLRHPTKNNIITNAWLEKNEARRFVATLLKAPIMPRYVPEWIEPKERYLEFLRTAAGMAARRPDEILPTLNPFKPYPQTWSDFQPMLSAEMDAAMVSTMNFVRSVRPDLSEDQVIMSDKLRLPCARLMGRYIVQFDTNNASAGTTKATSGVQMRALENTTRGVWRLLKSEVI